MLLDRAQHLNRLHYLTFKIRLFLPSRIQLNYFLICVTIFPPHSIHYTLLAFLPLFSPLLFSHLLFSTPLLTSLFFSYLTRLDVSADPGTILNSTPPNTMVLCLQLCPHQKGSLLFSSLFDLIIATGQYDEVANLSSFNLYYNRVHILIRTLSIDSLVPTLLISLFFLYQIFTIILTNPSSPHTHTHNQYCMRVWV